MPLGKIETPYVRNQLARLQQGDLLRDLAVSEVSSVSNDGVEVSERNLPYAVILSQDCDLEHDFNSSSAQGDGKDDKMLPALLLCPAYIADALRSGQHLKDQNRKMQRINSDEWRKLTSNQVYRYHYLEPWPDLQVPELVVDFKHYFTVSRGLAYRKELRDRYLATLEILYREHLSSRFAHYFSRIGLPELTSP